MLKEYLTKVLNEKRAAEKNLSDAIITEGDQEKRARIGEELKRIRDEIDEAERMLAELDKPADDKKPGKDDETVVVVDDQRKFNFVATQRNQTAGAEKRNADKYDTPEYRNAFMNFVAHGTPIPTELRATTKTTDTTAVIPTTTLNEIVREMKVYGNLFDEVRKLNIQGGVEVPILSLKPTATWITADTGTSESNDQKLEAKTSVSFNYYGLECKIAQTLLVNVTTYQAFQDLFVPMAAEAMAQALDVAIMNGSGSGQPLGITKDTRVPAANVITLSPAEIGSWSAWKKNVFANMKKAYRDGKFYMNQATFDGYIDGMVDANGQPIGRVNYGIDGDERYRFGGKIVDTVEDDVLAAYDDASDNDVIAVFVKPSDYAFNSNLEMQTVRWVDNDTNTIKNKAILVGDGKLIDPYGVLIIKKGAAAAAADADTNATPSAGNDENQG